MCALFGPGVRVHGVALAFDGGAVELDLQLPTTVHQQPLLAAVSQAPDLAVAAPELVPGPDIGFPADALSTHGLGGKPFLLTATSWTWQETMRPVIRKDLAFVRSLPVLKRGVPARKLTEEQLAYWIKRLSDAKRVSPRHVQLVAVFPDMQLEGDRPVTYRHEEEAIAYPLPEHPVSPSTIVMARHALTGEPLQGRFYREQGSS